VNLEDIYRLLRSDHVQAQGIVDTLVEPLLVLDQSLSVLSANRSFYETFRVSRDETVGQSIFALGNHQWDVPDLRVLLGEVIPRSAAVIGFEVKHAFPSIGARTYLVSARRLVHPDNNSTSILVTFEDVSVRRGEEAAKDILLGEMRHRMKNLLGVVRAMANQTDAVGRTGVEYKEAFLGRLTALLEAQDIAGSGVERDIETLLRRALTIAEATNVQIGPGPKVEVSAVQAQALSMLLHEMATNALKHGALSRSGGTLRITWAVDDATPPALEIDWVEEKGPPVHEPERHGFGMRLIEYTARVDLDGKAELAFEPEGFRAKLTLPLT
jgi:two-component sensor histidine kinase